MLHTIYLIVFITNSTIIDFSARIVLKYVLQMYYNYCFNGFMKTEFTKFR